MAVLCRVGARICALPLGHVVETMRPLPIEPVRGAPTGVLGLAVIRGKPTPVVDLGSVLGARGESTTRFVTVRTGDRSVALAVDSVIGVRDLATVPRDAMPPLVREAIGDAAAAIGALDGELLLVLRGARLISDDAWRTIDVDSAPS